MLTDESRRRLCEFLGWKWPNQAQFNSWDHEVMPLLAKIVERGEWESFRLWVKYEYDKVNWHGGVADCDAWMFANFADPSHTAGLIAEWLERKEG